ncbi:MAG: N-acyl homoserine lactonase family protein [Pseudomonadota bacterium]
MSDWEVYAVKYADRNARTRADSFILDDAHDAPHAMDYFIWVLRQGARVILVDTGYDAVEAAARGRPIRLDPREALHPFDLRPEDVGEIIVTHLHYDHAGGLALFPKAHLHLQAAEMAFATGPCMCSDTARAPFTGEHVCEAVRRLYGGKLSFHDQDAEVADGVYVHRIGGHSLGLQAVRVRTRSGWMVLASDGAHYYENLWARKLFPIVQDRAQMLRGFDRLEALASRPDLIVPGHDPLVTQVFERAMADHVFRLDTGPLKAIPGVPDNRQS